MTDRGIRSVKLRSAWGSAPSHCTNGSRGSTEPALGRTGRLARRECTPEGRAQTRRGGTRHPKKGRRVLCQGIRVRCAFVAAHRREFRLTTMCRVLRMHRSGFSAWMKTPQSRRAKNDERLLGKIRTFYPASDGAYGSPRGGTRASKYATGPRDRHLPRLHRPKSHSSIR